MKKKSSKNQFQKNIERFTPILASIREAVIITEPNGTILSANPATELITSLLPDDLLNTLLQKTLALSCDRKTVLGLLHEALEGSRAVELPTNCQVKQPRGKVVPVAGIATPLFTPEGDHAGIVLVLRDLTQEMRRKQRQYEFLSFFSHQFRQPVD